MAFLFHESDQNPNLLWAEHRDPFIVDGSILTRTIVGTSDGAGDLGFVAPHWTGGGGINLRSSVLQNIALRSKYDYLPTANMVVTSPRHNVTQHGTKQITTIQFTVVLYHCL